MAGFIAVFESDAFSGESYLPFSAQTKHDALEFLYRTTDQSPVRLYREVPLAPTDQKRKVPR